MSSRENYEVRTLTFRKKNNKKNPDRWLSNIPIILLEVLLLEHLESIIIWPYGMLTLLHK